MFVTISNYVALKSSDDGPKYGGGVNYPSLFRRWNPRDGRENKASGTEELIKLQILCFQAGVLPLLHPAANERLRKGRNTSPEQALGTLSRILEE